MFLIMISSIIHFPSYSCESMIIDYSHSIIKSITFSVINVVKKSMIIIHINAFCLRKSYYNNLMLTKRWIKRFLSWLVFVILALGMFICLTIRSENNIIFLSFDLDRQNAIVKGSAVQWTNKNFKKLSIRFTPPQREPSCCSPVWGIRMRYR